MTIRERRVRRLAGAVRLAGFMACMCLIALPANVARAVTIDLVTVGNAGNQPDTQPSQFFGPLTLGDVPYEYQLGKYEITAGQYVEFLNAVAGNDTYGLYHPGMASQYGCQILQFGFPGNWTYSVPPTYADRPVNYVSFWSAARFANWLHNGQPSGFQGPGSTESGAYSNIGNHLTFARQPGAKFFIPTENEWYKAAYHDKNAGVAGTYFDYATGSDTLPGRDMTETTSPGNNANYYDIPYPIDSGIYYTTNVGEFELSNSPYGTFDQNGNVHEWTETVYHTLTTFRVVRGGGAFSGSSFLPASNQYTYGADWASELFGFRIAAAPVPEPSTFVLGGVGTLAFLAFAVRRRAAR